jgi:hypothetical protein
MNREKTGGRLRRENRLESFWRIVFVTQRKIMKIDFSDNVLDPSAEPYIDP